MIRVLVLLKLYWHLDLRIIQAKDPVTENDVDQHSKTNVRNCREIECNVVSPFNSAAGNRPIKGSFRLLADCRNEPLRYKRLLLENIRNDDCKEMLRIQLEQCASRNIIKLRELKETIISSALVDFKQIKIYLIDGEFINSGVQSSTRNLIYPNRKVENYKIYPNRKVKILINQS